MANLKLTGIGKNGGFLLSNKGPLDVRTVVTEYNHLADLVSGNRAYAGMLVYVNSSDDKKGLYICENLNETGTWKLINTGAEIDSSINDYLKNYYTKEEIEEIKTTINSNLEENYATLIYVDENINNHLENKTNPHEVTAEQIGLGNVLNVESYSKVESDELLKNYALKEELFSKNYDDLTNKPEIPSIDGLATEEYVDKAIEAIPEVDLTDYALKDDIRYAEEGLTNSIDTHTKNKNNPHEITAEQIGLGNVLNVASYSKTENDELLKNYALKEELFSKSYNDLTDKPEIPDLAGYATEGYVDAEVKAELEKLIIPSIDGLATEEYVDGKIKDIDAIVGDLNITYTNDMETINAVGGVPAGFKFEGEWTIQDILTKLFYPYIDLDYDETVFKNRISIGTSSGTVTTASKSYTIPNFPTLNSITFYLKKNSATNLSFKLYAGNEQIGSTLTGDNIVRGTNGGNDSITFTNLNKKIEVNTTFKIELVYTGENDSGQKEEISKEINAGSFSFTFTNPTMSAPTAYVENGSSAASEYYVGQTAKVRIIKALSPTLNSASKIKKIELYKNGSKVGNTVENPTFPHNFSVTDDLTSTSESEVYTRYKIKTYFDTRTGSSIDTSETSIDSSECKITFKYSYPTISLGGKSSNSSISKLIPESVGSLTATFAKNSGKITSVKLFEKSKDYSTSTEVKSNTITGYDSDAYNSSNGTSTLNYSKNNICSNLTWTAKAYNGNTAVATSNSITLEFYPPFCYGHVGDITLDSINENNFADLVKSFPSSQHSKSAPRTVNNKGVACDGFELPATSTPMKILFAVPNGTYSNAYDINFAGSSVTGSFDKTTKTMKFADGSTQSYQVWLLKTVQKNAAKLEFK